VDVIAKSPKKLQGRVVVVESIYHQPANDQPKVVDNSYLCRIDSDEQAYGPRRAEVGEAWQPLDVGWIKCASVMAIRNEEGKFTQTIPTEDQIAEAEAKVIEVGIQDGVPGPMSSKVFSFAVLSTQQSLRIPPSNLSNYRIRCVKGTARYSISLFPK